MTGERKPRLDLFAAATMVFLTFVWGINGVAGKVAVGGFDPYFLSFLRAVLGGLAVYGWCRYRGIAIFQADGSLGAGTLVGLLFGVEFLLIYAGLDLTSASRANLMTNTMPLFALAGSHFLLGEKATMVKVAGTLAAFAGVFAVFFDKLSLPSPNAVYGDLLSIAAGAAWAATALVIRRTRLASLTPEKTLLYQLAGAAVTALPFLPFSDGLVRQIDAPVLASLIFQSFFVVAFTYVVWFWLLGRYPLSGLAAFTFLSPVFGVLASAAFLGEPLTNGLLTGLGLIAFGLLVVNSPQRKARA